jgi:hypothetical protein
MANKKLNKKELTEILVNEYGYEKEDLKNAEGKPFTNAELEAMIKQEEKHAERAEFEETIVPAEKYVEVKDEDLIQVMNGEQGELIHRSRRTGRMWKFTKFGQVDKMPFVELLNIQNKNSKCFEEGRLIILNKNVVEQFGLEDVYKNIVTPQNLDDLFTKDVEEVTEAIKNLPQSMKSTFFARAKELYSQGKLDSIKLKNAIEKEYGISIEDNAPLDDIAISFEPFGN